MAIVTSVDPETIQWLTTFAAENATKLAHFMRSSTLVMLVVSKALADLLGFFLSVGEQNHFVWIFMVSVAMLFFVWFAPQSVPASIVVEKERVFLAVVALIAIGLFFTVLPQPIVYLVKKLKQLFDVLWIAAVIYVLLY